MAIKGLFQFHIRQLADKRHIYFYHFIRFVYSKFANLTSHPIVALFNGGTHLQPAAVRQVFNPVSNVDYFSIILCFTQTQLNGEICTP
jgi:hypothetical protein